MIHSIRLIVFFIIFQSIFPSAFREEETPNFGGFQIGIASGLRFDEINYQILVGTAKNSIAYNLSSKQTSLPLGVSLGYMKTNRAGFLLNGFYLKYLSLKESLSGYDDTSIKLKSSDSYSQDAYNIEAYVIYMPKILVAGIGFMSTYVF